MEKDIEDMLELGFTLLDVDYHDFEFKVNEADAFFYNSKLLQL